MSGKTATHTTAELPAGKQVSAVARTRKPAWLTELMEMLPRELHPLLEQRNGAALLVDELTSIYSPREVMCPGDAQRTWELTGLYYLNNRRFYEALPIFSALYHHILVAQEETGERAHKGMPLVWMSECYSAIGYPVHALRYLMLTLCEDAVHSDGVIPPDSSGVYFRLVWRHGIPDVELQDYAARAYRLYQGDPDNSQYPEWILQELGTSWMTEYPSLREARVYTVSTRYARHLMSQLGEPTGHALERLAAYLMSSMPGCRTARRERSHSSDYDLVCAMEGLNIDFRSEFGRYFVCECKDWNKPADFTTMAKFCRVLDSTKSRFGILFSKQGISGSSDTRYAAREQLKVFQDRGMVIVVMDMKDIEHIAEGGNLIQLLRRRYEGVRLDLAQSGEQPNDSV